MVRAIPGGLIRLLLLLGPLALGPGCSLVPRASMDECQQMTKALRTENARLRDRVLVLQNQNRDYAERAVDDARRLAMQDETIARLEQSVQSYQADRSKLESAYEQLTSSLDRLRSADDDWRTQARKDPVIDGDAAPRVSSRRPKSASDRADIER